MQDVSRNNDFRELRRIQVIFDVVQRYCTDKPIMIGHVEVIEPVAIRNAIEQMPPQKPMTPTQISVHPTNKEIHENPPGLCRHADIGNLFVRKTGSLLSSAAIAIAALIRKTKRMN